jgi:predicted patatin/cPLA2 family phospholipase
MELEEAAILLFAVTNGVMIKEAAFNGKNHFAIIVDFEKDEETKESSDLKESIKKKYGDLKNIAIKIFPTKKGALGFCRRKKYTISSKGTEGGSE